MFLSMRQIEIPCLVNPGRAAVLDVDHRAFINYEIYFFSDLEARKRFTKDPLWYCGLLTDPVNRLRFRPSKKSPHTEFNGRPYYFDSDSTLAVFRAMPDSFAVRRGM